MNHSRFNDSWFGLIADLLDRLTGGSGRSGSMWTRRAVAAALAGTFWWLAMKPFRIESDEGATVFSAFPPLIFGMAALISSAILFSPDLVEYAARPFTRWIDSIYLGSSEVAELPPLNYAPVDRAIQEKRWQQAAFEFERISQWYSNEMRPYFDGIMVARLANDSHTARELYRRGVAFFPDAENILLPRLEGPLMEVRALPME